jgi:stage II sporulation protein AA (anti-sigma F factor antagonist)
VGRLLVERHERGGSVLLTLYGEIDVESSRELERALEAVAGSQVKELAIDLDGLSFMDSTGLQLLARAAQQARENGHEVVLRRIPLHARRLFEVTGMLPLFKLA